MFENYYWQHQEAYQDLEMYGEIISQNKKVNDFLRGITDPTCAVAKGIVLTTPAYIHDFTAAASYIASMLNITLSHNARGQGRTIVSIQQDNGEKNKQRTGGGKHTNTKKNKGGGGNNKKLTRSYSSQERKQMSNEKRQKVI